MPVSTALTYRQTLAAIDNSAAGAGQMWNQVLYELFHYFFTTSEAVDTGRWRLVAHSLGAAADWNTVGNVVDNSWFVVEAFKGQRLWQAKFQNANVAALDEAPATTYSLVCRLSPDGGWTAKGDPNGGFNGTATPASNNLYVGGSDLTGNADSSVLIHGDRDTVLIAGTLAGKEAYKFGCYVGRFDRETSLITQPECLLTAWDGAGSPNGFDRGAGGAFNATPGGSYALDSTTTTDTVTCYTSSWLTSTYQPGQFTPNTFNVRPIEITNQDSYLGTLRLIWACGNLASGSRLDGLQKLVLHDADANVGICIQHNGLALIPPP